MRHEPRSLFPRRWWSSLWQRSRQGIPHRPGSVRLRLEPLEDRLAPTGNITITNAFLVNANDQPLGSTVNVGQQVYVQADFTTQGLPSNASYSLDFMVNGLTLQSAPVTWGAGDSGTGDWYMYWGTFGATLGTNQVRVKVDPESYGPSSTSFTFTGKSPAVGPVSYTVAQIRDAYGVNSIPHFGSATPDGTGQTIALDEAGNDPYILTDLDGFDQAMSLTTTSTQNLYQQYGAASSFVTVYNQSGTNITANIGTSGSNGVPAEDPSGHWEGEETLDVEWAHAIAPGAKIDIIEVNDDSNWPTNLLTGDALAASLPDVSAVSNSWGLDEWSGETAYDSSAFVTPAGHTGVTFLTASNDNGANVYGVYGPTVGSDGYYPATSPNVVSVGGTELTVNNNGYGSETGWSYPAPASTIDNGSSSYSQSGSWSAQSGGFSGTYSTAPGGSSSSATWTIAVTPANTGWGTEVSATWTASASTATNATYSIYDGPTGTLLATVPVNQTLAPVGTADGSYQFQELGVFFPTLDANGDGSLKVVLNAGSANGTVVADAVGAAQAWASTGGPSQFESEPSYQRAFQSTGFRTTPDVSFDASQNSGVTTYYTVFNDPSDYGLWYGGFGTSLSSPCWAGLIALANQGRVANGLATLNSPANPQQTLEALYSLPARDFHDITSGYNGFSAGSGYDLATGRGTPITNTLIPDLVNYARTDQWTGANFAVDTNWSDGANWSLGAPPTAGQTVLFTNNSTVKDFTSTVDAGFTNTIAGLDIDSSWGGTIDVNSPLTVTGNFTMASGTFGGSGAVTIKGTKSTWTGGTIDLGSGGFTNTGTLTYSGSKNVALDGSGSFTNKKSFVQTSTGTLTLENGATFDNAKGATYNLESNGGISQSGGGTFTNAGTLEKTKGTGTTTIGSSTLSNTGTVSVSTGTLDISATVSQVSGSTLMAGSWSVTGSSTVSSTLDITSIGNLTTIGSTAKVTLSGQNTTFTNLSGLSTIASGGSFTLSGGQDFTTAGALTNNGRLTLSPGSILTVSGSFTQSSTASLAIQLGGTNSAPTFGQLLSTTGSVTLAGKLSVTSTVVPAVGSSFNILDNEGNTTIGGMFANLAQGATFTVKKGSTSMTFGISYVGSDDDGSDNVVIKRTA